MPSQEGHGNYDIEHHDVVEVTESTDIEQDSMDNEELVNQISALDLKQNRLLGDGTHHYEQYSLPATRQHSYEARYTSSKTTSSSTSSQRSSQVFDESTSTKPRNNRRPSAAYLSAIDGGDTTPPVGAGPNGGSGGSGGSVGGGLSGVSFYLPNSRNDSTNSQNGSTRSSPLQSRENSPVSSPSLFPVADQDDPYARKHRPPQIQNLNEIEPRFVFKLKHSNRSHNSLMSLHHHHDKSSSSSLSPSKNEKPHHRHSGSFLRHHSHNQQQQHSKGSDSEDNSGGGSLHGSMVELKRFFKKGLKHHHRSRSSSPYPSHNSSHLSLSSASSSSNHVPFMEEGFKKYGKIGRVLGSGAGGSVRIMKRQSDGTVFAVKEFRQKHINESNRDYSKKVTAEFCIGSTLHHPNIIETLDIIQEGGKFYEVMEYCPYDFFAIVMSGRMSKQEIGCTFKQILSGVMYLHDIGLAHRDLKLDNCVVTDAGIVKIIDFGSASVFRYPFEEDIVFAKGVVGSDPYLAPEVLSEPKYDPRSADIWSIAVIFCCMTLRRFPWKAPRLSDNSFRLFSEPVSAEESQRQLEEFYQKQNQQQHHHHFSLHHNNNNHDDQLQQQQQQQQHPQVRGPWRLLRLLPQESRNIIGQMLEIEPTNRATMQEITLDEWVQSLQICTIDSKLGIPIKSMDHEHTFVPAEQAHLESYKKEK